MIQRLRKIRKKFSSLAKKARSEIILLFSDTLNISIGENCLTDNVLERHGLKSFTTPYSHGRSNLDYAIQLEKRDYVGLLDLNNLVYENVETDTVVRNRTDLTCDPIFFELHQNGFEFTHHDIIQNLEHRNSYVRKIKRLIKYRGQKTFRFFYHYRYNSATDLQTIANKAREFLSFYNSKKPNCEMIIFTQKLIPKDQEKSLEIRHLDKKIKAFIFQTYDWWAGENHDIFWAKVDDDLFKEMFKALDEKPGASST